MWWRAGDKLYQDGVTKIWHFFVYNLRRGVFPFLPKIYHIPAIPTYLSIIPQIHIV